MSCARQTRVLRSMSSTHEAVGFQYGEGGDDSRGNPETSQEAACSKEAADRHPTENQEEQAETNRDEKHSGPPLNPWDDDEPQHQRTTPQEENPLRAPPQTEERHQPTAGVPSASSSSTTARFSSEGERNQAIRLMPWWAGAFGAVPEMRDSPEARGFYARRFCEIFFPGNIAGATEVRQDNISRYLWQSSAFNSPKLDRKPLHFHFQ